jgi:MerR family Zn(II)-responsive transcriptional regulator of zntA
MDLTEIKYTIGKVAARLAVSTDTLRHYEKNGLITPTSKTAAGYRLYNEDVVNRVRFIKQAQSCGLTLSEVRELLMLKHSSNFRCKHVRNLAIERRFKIKQKLTALQAMLNTLDGLIENCDGGEMSIDNCTILETLENGQKISAN